jgi:DNA (cytosine-5)-methyltransferase 1
MIRHVDLFAGTGGFHLGFQDSNVQTVFANDFVNHSKLIYETNFSNVNFRLEDLNNIPVEEIPKHDLLTAGFPCQPFSIAGQRKGFQDPRSNVFWKILEILQIHQPQCVVLENVKNILTVEKTFDIIKTNLERVGYQITFAVLNTAELTGIPQHRERIYIIGFRNVAYLQQLSVKFPTLVKQPLEHFLESPSEPVDAKYYYTSNIPNMICGATKNQAIIDSLREQVTRADTVYQFRRVYVRENKNGECPTLTSNMGSGGHNVPIIMDSFGIRKLTPRECFNFQGFPKEYQFPSTMSNTSLYKLVGNAVSVPVVRLIAQRILCLMNKSLK